MTSSIEKLPRLKPRGGLRVMYASIRALFFRELQTRFGQYRLGYLWVFLEPLLSVGLLVVLFGALHSKVLPSVEYEVFLVNGMLPFLMFKRGIVQALNANKSNMGLFSYRPVKPVDALIARNLLEGCVSFSTYVLFNAILIWCGFHISFEAIPQLLGYWLSLFVFMVAISFILMVVGDFSKELGKFISAAFFLLQLLSAIIYSIHVVPSQYQVYLLWNPLIHVIEHIRNCVAPTYPLATGIDFGYFMEWTVGSLFIGLLLYKRFERRMVKIK